MTTLEDIYERLKVIKAGAKDMTEDSFDKTKAFKFVYNQLLDVIDDLEYLEQSNDLFDDENDIDNLLDNEKSDTQETVTNNSISLEDLDW